MRNKRGFLKQCCNFKILELYLNFTLFHLALGYLLFIKRRGDVFRFSSPIKTEERNNKAIKVQK